MVRHEGMSLTLTRDIGRTNAITTIPLIECERSGFGIHSLFWTLHTHPNDSKQTPKTTKGTLK